VKRVDVVSDPKYLSIFLVLVFLAFGAQPTNAKERMTPEFDSGQTRPASVALLPLQADMVKKKAVMHEQMVSEAGVLENFAFGHIARELEQKGYLVKRLSPEKVNADPALQELVLRANKRYQEEWKKLAAKIKKVEERRYNVGEEARLVAARLGVDGLVFARVHALAVTKGASAMGALIGIGGPATSLANLHVSVVNGKTADVEAHFYSVVSTSVTGLTTNADDTMAKLAGKALEDLPAAGTTVTAEQQSTGPRKEGGKSEQAVLAEVEALLAGKASADQATAQTKTASAPVQPASPGSKQSQPTPSEGLSVAAPAGEATVAMRAPALTSRYRIGIFPAEGQFAQANTVWDEKHAARVFRERVGTDSAFSLAYSYYDLHLSEPALKARGKLWVAAEKPNLKAVEKEARARNLDGVFLYRSAGFYAGYADRVSNTPMPIELYMIDVTRNQVYHRKGTTDNLGAMIQGLFSEFLGHRRG
jgi:hypothetical protein